MLFTLYRQMYSFPVSLIGVRAEARRPLWNDFRFCEREIANFRTLRLVKWLFKRNSHSCRAMVVNNELENLTDRTP
jgi:hypothetical protein